MLACNRMAKNWTLICQPSKDNFMYTRKSFLLSCLLSIMMMSAAQNSNDIKPASAGHAPVNGIQMYYEVYGEGDIPIVLIHGGGSAITSTFGRVLKEFAARRKVIALELQAHGRTSDRNAPETFEQDADDVAGLLQYLKIKKADIVGFSNGGTTTLQLAIRHPQLVHKIVPVAAAWKRGGMMTGFFDFMQQASLDNMPAPLKEAFLAVNPDKNKLQTMFEKDKARMIHFKDITDTAIRKISAPTLVICGDRDVVTVEHAVSTVQQISGARLAILPGTHGEYLGDILSPTPESHIPALTVQLILEFLAAG